MSMTEKNIVNLFQDEAPHTEFADHLVDLKGIITDKYGDFNSKTLIKWYNDEDNKKTRMFTSVVSFFGTIRVFKPQLNKFDPLKASFRILFDDFTEINKYEPLMLWFLINYRANHNKLPSFVEAIITEKYGNIDIKKGIDKWLNDTDDKEGIDILDALKSIFEDDRTIPSVPLEFPDMYTNSIFGHLSVRCPQDTESLDKYGMSFSMGGNIQTFHPLRALFGEEMPEALYPYMKQIKKFCGKDTVYPILDIDFKNGDETHHQRFDYNAITMMHIQLAKIKMTSESDDSFTGLTKTLVDMIIKFDKEHWTLQQLVGEFDTAHPRNIPIKINAKWSYYTMRFYRKSWNDEGVEMDKINELLKMDINPSQAMIDKQRFWNLKMNVFVKGVNKAGSSRFEPIMNYVGFTKTAPLKPKKKPAYQFPTESLSPEPEELDEVIEDMERSAVDSDDA